VLVVFAALKTCSVASNSRRTWLIFSNFLGKVSLTSLCWGQNLKNGRPWKGLCYLICQNQNG